MKKVDLLTAITFGERVAEQEEDLHSYFVETAPWHGIFSGNKDIVYGAKGSGKSAIYSLLVSRRDELLRRHIIVVPAENPRGLPVFKDLIIDPPTKENEFRNLWKLYFLTLVASALRDNGVSGDCAKQVIKVVVDAGLLNRDHSKESSLARTLGLVREYARVHSRIESFEAGGRIDTNNLNQPVPKITGKITFHEPDTSQKARGLISADNLLKIANQALEDAELSVWLALDRLDAAFDDSEMLENNALRSLFRVYLDLTKRKQISLKIFLRSDIWQRLATQQRLSEASHITRTTVITWDSKSLLNLIIRRALHNEELRQYYNVDDRVIWRDPKTQVDLFYRIFPLTVEDGGSLRTFDWMQKWTRDGSGWTTPRELIHLLSEAREIQIQKLWQGEDEPTGEVLFTPESLRDALPAVSRIRYNQTFCSEFPRLADLTVWLEGKDPQQTADTLAVLWGNDREKALALANDLFDVGLFERKGSRESPIFEVPPLYRHALKMVGETPEVNALVPGVPAEVLERLENEEPQERAKALETLVDIGGEDSFYEITAAFDDPSQDVRNAAARALYNLSPDRAASFTRALREGTSERRRQIGAALFSSGLAIEAIGQLMGENREKTYDAFSLLFLMAKAGELEPLMNAVKEHPNNEVRLAVVKLLALSGQEEVLPELRRLAIIGKLPTEVRSAVMEAIYQITSKISSN